MRRTTHNTFNLMVTGLALAAALLGGCTRGPHSANPSGGNQPPSVQPSGSDPVEGEYNSLDQDLQTLNNQLKTPELPADYP